MKTGGMLGAATLVLLGVLGGCAGDVDIVPRCTPGASAACTCPTGQSGAQVCGSNGAYAACVCQSSPTDAATSQDVATGPDVIATTDAGVATDVGVAMDVGAAPDAGGPTDAGGVDVVAPPVDRPEPADAPGVSCVSPGLCNVAKLVLAGSSQACVLMRNERVYCWGRGWGTPAGVPARLVEFDDVTALTSMTGTFCLQRRSVPGRIYCPNSSTSGSEVVPDVIDVV